MDKEIFETALKQTMYLIVPFSTITIFDGVSIGERFILIDFYYKGTPYLIKLEYNSQKLELPYQDMAKKIHDALVVKLHRELDKLLFLNRSKLWQSI